VGFLLVDGSFLRIEATAGVYSSARGLNSQGDIVGQDGDPATAAFHGFARIGGRFPVVNGPTAALSWNIQGINDLGLIVGEVTNGTGTHGYLGRPAPDASVFTTDDTRLPVEENPRASAPSDALPGAPPRVVAPVVTLSLQPGESTGSVRWNTAVGSPAAATFIARHVGNSSNGEVHVNNHDGVSFSGTISCYHQSGPRAAWFSGTIDRFEGSNTRGNRQGTTTFIMSVTAADPSSHNNGRVTLVRGSTPFDCSTFHDGRQPVTAGAVITALR
jgi:hypothetical protein